MAISYIVSFFFLSACSNNYILQMQNTSFKLQASQKLVNSYGLKMAEITKSFFFLSDVFPY